MNPGRAVVVAALLAVWAVVPWPLARWAALSAAVFVGLGALWSWLLSRGVKVVGAEPLVRTFSGRRLEIVTRVENRSPLPSGLLAVFDSAGGLETWGDERHWASLPPFTRRRFGFTVRGRERGERTLGPLTIAGADPTGLFPFSVADSPRSLLVYPPVHRVSGWPRDGIPTGPRKWEPALVDDPSRFRSYRDFQPGDPLSRLSAAAWARRGTPQVRVYDRTVARPSGVVVDLRASLYPLRLRWALVEAAVETAACLVWEALGRGEKVWLTVIDAHPTTVGPCRGWAEARPLLEALARAVADKTPEPRPWSAGLLPPAPLRLFWVGPSGPAAAPRGYERIDFPVGEGGTLALVHP